MTSSGDLARAEEIHAAWEPFRPVWSNILSVGSGTSVGFWRRCGPQAIEVAASLTWGSDTDTPLPGNPFGLFLPDRLVGDSSVVQIVPAMAVDVSAGRAYAGRALVESSGSAQVLSPIHGGTGGEWDEDSPMTWAEGDILVVQGLVRVTT